MVFKYREFIISSADWGDIPVLCPTPSKESFWGGLECLRETPWGKLIPVIPGEVYSHALHGYTNPLMDHLGPEPRMLLKRMKDPEVVACRQRSNCMIANDKCVPGPDLQRCYEPVGFTDPLSVRAASIVALAWSENRYVVVVSGPEFSI